MFDDGCHAAPLARDGELVLAALGHVLLLTGTYFGACSVGVAALQHQHTFATAMAMSWEAHAGGEAQQPGASGAFAGALERKGSHAPKWGKRPALRVTRACQLL